MSKMFQECFELKTIDVSNNNKDKFKEIVSEHKLKIK
jgi:hypothetical protein